MFYIYILGFFLPDYNESWNAGCCLHVSSSLDDGFDVLMQVLADATVEYCSVVLPASPSSSSRKARLVTDDGIELNNNKVIQTARSAPLGSRPATPCPGAAQLPPSRPAGQYAPARILCRRERPVGRAVQTLQLPLQHFTFGRK